MGIVGVMRTAVKEAATALLKPLQQKRIQNLATLLVESNYISLREKLKVIYGKRQYIRFRLAIRVIIQDDKHKLNETEVRTKPLVGKDMSEDKREIIREVMKANTKAVGKFLLQLKQPARIIACLEDKHIKAEMRKWGSEEAFLALWYTQTIPVQTEEHRYSLISTIIVGIQELSYARKALRRSAIESR